MFLALIRHGVLICVAVITANAQALERWDRAVCLLAESCDAQGNTNTQIGSAFLVDVAGEVALVTATHVSTFTDGHSKLLFRAPDGPSRFVLLGALNATDGSPWKTHDHSDLAVMRVCAKKVSEENRAWLSALAIPVTALASASPARTTKVELTGFPLSLGLTRTISPLVTCAAVASRELECDGKWGKEQLWYASPVVGDGVSGGPVFEAYDDSARLSVVGMYTGYASDQSGPKLARVVPSRLIFEMIAKQLDFP